MSYGDEQTGPVIDKVALTAPGDTDTFAPFSRGSSDLILLLWLKRKQLLRVFLCGLVISALIAILIPNCYESTARLMPPDVSSPNSAMLMSAGLLAQGSAGSGAAGMLAGDLLGLKNAGSLFVGMLRSESVEDELIKRFDLKAVYHCRYAEDARQELADNTIVIEDRKSGIISIAVRDKNPQRAAALAAAYVEVLDRLNARLNVSSAHKERVFLEQRLGEVRLELDRDSRALSQFSSKSATLDPKEQGKSLFDAAARLEGELIASQTELAGVEQIYTPNNVRARALKARIEELTNQLRTIRGNGDGSVLPEESTQLYPSITDLPILGATYGDLYRNVKIQEAVFETLTKQYEIAKVQEAKETATVQVLDPPLVPQKKASPPRVVLTLGGAFFVFAFAVIWYALKEQWDRAEENDVRKLFIGEIFSSIASVVPVSFRNLQINLFLHSKRKQS